jgi:GxxExxY protein
MPITCPVQVHPVTEEEFKRLDHEVMRQAFASHNQLGRLCGEKVYQNDLTARMVAAGLKPLCKEVPVTVSHRDFRKTYYLDIIVGDTTVYELKAVSTLTGDHEKQILHYLLLLGGNRGKLVNFRTPSVQYQTVNAVLAPDEQRRYEIVANRWQDLDERNVLLRRTLTELMDEWGVFLELSLYEEALTFFLGGEHSVLRNLPLAREGIALGTQRVHLTTDSVGFKLTALTDPADHAESHLRRFLALTGLRALHSINFNRHRIELVTLVR